MPDEVGKARLSISAGGGGGGGQPFQQKALKKKEYKNGWRTTMIQLLTALCRLRNGHGLPDKRLQILDEPGHLIIAVQENRSQSVCGAGRGAGAGKKWRAR